MMPSNRFDEKQVLSFLTKIEKMKCLTRHCETSEGKKESVAEHTFSCAVLSLLLRDEFPELDMQKVTEMCLIHDFGEAVTGDIPAFLKTEADERTEDGAVEDLLSGLPEGLHSRWTALFAEMRELHTPEAQLFKALDKLDAVHQHNLSPLSSWMDLERELNLTYGVREAAEFPATKRLRQEMLKETKQKLQDE